MRVCVCVGGGLYFVEMWGGGCGPGRFYVMCEISDASTVVIAACYSHTCVLTSS